MNSYTTTVDETIRELIKLNVNVKQDVLQIQNKITQTMSFLIDSNTELNHQNNESRREGFLSSISCGIESKTNNILNYAVIGLLVSGFIAYTRK